MAGKVIMCAVCFGCAILFFAIGVHPKRLKKPMWFWFGTAVGASNLTDVERYNQENGAMWQLYSLWYFGAGLAELWNTIAAVALLVLSCTVGIAFLVSSYNRIYRKYAVK